VKEKNFKGRKSNTYFISSSGTDFLASYGSGSSSTRQKVTVPMVLDKTIKMCPKCLHYLTLSNLRGECGVVEENADLFIRHT
jgi:hypothetical protein